MKNLGIFLAEAFVSVPKAQSGLGYLREQLPQLGKEDDFNSFSNFCKTFGTRISKKSFKARDLNPSQNEIDFDKVVNIVQDYTQTNPPAVQPIVVDKDGYIIDGHHRWAALMYMNPNMELPVYQFNVTIKHLLNNKVPRWQDTVGNDNKLTEAAPIEIGDIWDKESDHLWNDVEKAIEKVCKDYAARLTRENKGKSDDGQIIKNIKVTFDKDLPLEDYIKFDIEY